MVAAGTHGGGGLSLFPPQRPNWLCAAPLCLPLKAKGDTCLIVACPSIAIPRLAIRGATIAVIGGIVIV